MEARSKRRRKSVEVRGGVGLKIKKRPPVSELHRPHKLIFKIIHPPFVYIHTCVSPWCTSHTHVQILAHVYIHTYTLKHARAHTHT